MCLINERLMRSGIVPVVVIDDAKDAVPVARALLDGGIDVMEVTFRTGAAGESIRAVTKELPEMLVGAGTVVNLEQCKEAVACGARFIVSPGYDEETVAWCCSNDIAVIPGCVTPTEIMSAMKHGLKVLKFFPANVYGGISALKALAGPFGGVRFVPTGGVNLQNLAEYISSPYVHAVGGSWVCTRKDIKEHNFARITALCRDARAELLGFEIAHIGINSPDNSASLQLCRRLQDAFGFIVKEGRSSNFASEGIEVMNTIYKGSSGHIAIRTNTIEAAIAELEKNGFEFDWSTVKDPNHIKAIYLQGEFGGFAVHLLQK